MAVENEDEDPKNTLQENAQDVSQRIKKYTFGFLFSFALLFALVTTSITICALWFPGQIDELVLAILLSSQIIMFITVIVGLVSITREE